MHLPRLPRPGPRDGLRSARAKIIAAGVLVAVSACRFGFDELAPDAVVELDPPTNPPNAPADAAVASPPDARPDAAPGCTTVGPRTPKVASNGPGSASWSNPEAVLVLDGSGCDTLTASGAVVRLFPFGATTSSALRAADFGFAIPSGATVTGVEVQIRKCARLPFIGDGAVQLIIGGSIAGADKQQGTWPLSYAITTYGGGSDTWAATLSPDTVNRSDFGVAVSARYTATSGNSDAAIDHITMSVTYCGG